MELSGRIVIAGGTGFLGLNLARYLGRFNCEAILLSRHPPVQTSHWRHVAWDARTPGEWVSLLDGAAALVNLAGRTVDCVKTPDHCDEILRSRVEATEVLGQAIRRVQSPPPVWVQMATAHCYGEGIARAGHHHNIDRISKRAQPRHGFMGQNQPISLIRSGRVTSHPCEI
ncbi:MAG: NAD-dependent epimerase/dehydratase family protein [Thermoguttaceae bacterium]